jgi:ubiquinol-cytochrome c reductase cytochrome c subunit
VKRWISLLSACALAGLLVTGCTKSPSSSEQSTGAATEAPAAATEAPAAATEAPAAATAIPAASATSSQGPLGDAAHGAAVFTQNCASCHGAAGIGGGIGATLKDEKSRKDFKAAVAWIENPKPPMPKLYPESLTEKDVDDVAAYVETL